MKYDLESLVSVFNSGEEDLMDQNIKASFSRAQIKD